MQRIRTSAIGGISKIPRGTACGTASLSRQEGIGAARGAKLLRFRLITRGAILLAPPADAIVLVTEDAGLARTTRGVEPQQGSRGARLAVEGRRSNAGGTPRVAVGAAAIITVLVAVSPKSSMYA